MNKKNVSIIFAPQIVISVKKKESTIYSSCERARTTFWSKYQGGRYFAIIYDQSQSDYGCYWNGSFNSFGIQYRIDPKHWTNITATFVTNHHLVWWIIKLDFRIMLNWKEQNCITLKLGTKVTHWFFCFMDFQIVGWVGVVFYFKKYTSSFNICYSSVLLFIILLHFAKKNRVAQSGKVLFQNISSRASIVTLDYHEWIWIHFSRL